MYPDPEEALKNIKLVEKRSTTFQIKTLSPTAEPAIFSKFLEQLEGKCDVHVEAVSDDGLWAVTVTPHLAGRKNDSECKKEWEGGKEKDG